MKRGRCLSQVAVIVVGVWEGGLKLPRGQPRSIYSMTQGGVRAVLQIQSNCTE